MVVVRWVAWRFYKYVVQYQYKMTKANRYKLAFPKKKEKRMEGWKREIEERK
jgi:hypothetical protein